MGVYTRNSIITSGLVLHLDAANKLSYPGSGTTWNDLSGNKNNGTLVNSPSFSTMNGGTLVFNGSNNYVSVPITPSINITTNITINVWYYNKVWKESDIIESGTNGMMIWTYQSINSIRVGRQSLGTQLTTSTISTLLNTWMNITFTYDAVTLKAYFNGKFDTSIGVNFTFVNILLTIGAGISATGDGYFNGNISNVQIYNRALTANEILQNYNAMKGRYI